MEDEIPQSFYDKLRTRVLAKTPNKDANGMGCWQWAGGLKTGGRYGTEYLHVGGDRMCVNAHRAAYIAFNRAFLLPFDISHCCHQSLCVNPNHLSHEPHDINMDRERCRKAGKCYGHYTDGNGLKPCLFLQTTTTTTTTTTTE